MNGEALFYELMKIHKNDRNFNLLAADFKAGRLFHLLEPAFLVLNFRHG